MTAGPGRPGGRRNRRDRRGPGSGPHPSLARPPASRTDRDIAEIVEANQSLVGAVIERRNVWAKWSELDRDDVWQAGMVGLLKAARKFDPDFGGAFSTFAYWWAYNEIRHLARKEGVSVEAGEDTSRIGWDHVEVEDHHAVTDHHAADRQAEARNELDALLAVVHDPAVRDALVRTETGMSLERIARRHGISEKDLRRRVQAAMEQLEAIRRDGPGVLPHPVANDEGGFDIVWRLPDTEDGTHG